jgi:rhodanese-related sulfurtransferase
MNQKSSDKKSKVVNQIVNVALGVMAAVFVYSLIRGYLPGADGKADIVTPGSKLQVVGVNWAGQNESLVFVMSTTCHFCSESAPFYRRLTAALNQRADLQVFAVLPQAVDEDRKYLESLGVPIREIRQADLKSIRVPLTPSLIRVNNAGQVLDIWTGRLSSKQEQDVFNRLQLKDVNEVADASSGVTRIDFSAMKNALSEKKPMVILDVEERDVFRAGHIPGAVNIPADELEVRAGEELSPNDSIVIYSDDADLSERATEILSENGFKRLSLLNGGYSQWEKYNREAR